MTPSNRLKFMSAVAGFAGLCIGSVIGAHIAAPAPAGYHYDMPEEMPEAATSDILEVYARDTVQGIISIHLRFANHLVHGLHAPQVVIEGPNNGKGNPWDFVYQWDGNNDGDPIIVAYPADSFTVTHK